MGTHKATPVKDFFLSFFTDMGTDKSTPAKSPLTFVQKKREKKILTGVDL